MILKPQAIIFDLDGVITDTAHLHFLAWRQVAGEIGIAINEAFNDSLKGISLWGRKSFDTTGRRLN
ncbi:hypothetical protein KM92CIT3_80568 [uncultured Citrobacter sp.]|uniref:Beta-phosphoglucomutase n=1 Tax=uncultured Citrobacter sp. TaxID=200446 RepID=A0A212II20_9ENTR|nr:hypothetical protein KL86CIT2_50043 [uncultured Citrobacter sp.]SBV67850.1 hypothetical protein KM92CIT3_80568 [uncultured Citrobacter sp.]